MKMIFGKASHVEPTETLEANVYKLPFSSLFAGRNSAKATETFQAPAG